MRYRAGSRGNIARLRADAGRVVERLLSGRVTLRVIMLEYRVAYPTLRKFYHARTTPEQRAASLRILRRRAGRKGGFRPGHVPWTKGRKGIRLSPATEFKAGCIRGAAARKYKAVGKITIRSDKPPKRLRGRKRKGDKPWPSNRRRWIKVRELVGTNRPQDRWMPYARWLWIREHGAIPDGFFVVHADGNTMNDSPPNLRLVDNRGHLALQVQRDPGMMERCHRRAGEAARTRHAVARAVKASRRSTKSAWQCAACAAGVDPDTQDRCAKCGGGAFEEIAMHERIA